MRESFARKLVSKLMSVPMSMASTMLLVGCTSFPGGAVNPGLEGLEGKPIYLVAQRVTLYETKDLFSNSYRASRCEYTGRILTSGNQQLGYVSQRETACGWIDFDTNKEGIISGYSEGGIAGLRPYVVKSLKPIADAPTREAAERLDLTPYYGAMGYNESTGKLIGVRNHVNVDAAKKAIKDEFTLLNTFSNSCAVIAVPERKDKKDKSPTPYKSLYLESDVDPKAAAKKAITTCEAKSGGKCVDEWEAYCTGALYGFEQSAEAKAASESKAK